MSNDIRLLSHAFRTDAAHNYEIANVIKAHHLYPRESMRAKVMVILHMAIECALKCIIVMERPEKDVGQIYKILKKGGHDLSKLVSAVIDPVIDLGMRNRLKGFNPPGVHIRYGFEMMILAGDDLFSSGRSPELTDAKLDEAFDLAKFMVELANGIHATKYPVILQWTDGDNPERVIKRIKQASAKRQ